jgi:hypothetical protein
MKQIRMQHLMIVVLLSLIAMVPRQTEWYHCYEHYHTISANVHALTGDTLHCDVIVQPDVVFFGDFAQMGIYNHGHLNGDRLLMGSIGNRRCRLLIKKLSDRETFMELFWPLSADRDSVEYYYLTKK